MTPAELISTFLTVVLVDRIISLPLLWMVKLEVNVSAPVNVRFPASVATPDKALPSPKNEDAFTLDWLVI